MGMRVCVFCGSKPGASSVYRDAAKRLGQALAMRGDALVYGGGNVGLMGAVAAAAHAGGASVTGVIPEALLPAELSGHTVGETVVVKDMHERKAKMAALADAFIALPGGLGTMEELFEVATWQQLGFHAKPVAMLNVDGYYDALNAFLAHANTQGFILDKHASIILSGDEPEELLDVVRVAAMASHEKPQ